MELDHLLARCRACEERAAAIYRRFAARTRRDPAMCALWTALARDEESHAALLTQAERWLDRADGWHTALEGWDEALAEIEERLEAAEQPHAVDDPDHMLAAALALERTELDTLSRRLLRSTREPMAAEEPTAHIDRLLAAADRSQDHTVRMEAALLRASTALRHSA